MQIRGLALAHGSLCNLAGTSALWKEADQVAQEKTQVRWENMKPLKLQAQVHFPKKAGVDLVAFFFFFECYFLTRVQWNLLQSQDGVCASKKGPSSELAK